MTKNEKQVIPKITISARLGFVLEDLCREILSANNWVVEEQDQFVDTGIDIIAVEPASNSKVIFEVKYTRNSLYPSSALKISVERLAKMACEIGVSKAVLIVAADIKPEVKKRLETQYQIQIINLDGLLGLASVDLELLGKLVKLCEIDIAGRSFDSDLNGILHPQKIDSSSDTSSSNQNESLGKAFIDKIKSIPPGRAGCYDFEDAVCDILQYLFDDDLVGWHKQNRTTDDLHRYDLICRVVDKSLVWKFISSNLDSRYVLFEFKNYKEEIGQAQVYSTEKYLYENAKRRVCFLISRFGPSENAKVACEGAMREHGKLIVNLDDNILFKLINSKIAGDDPNELLYEKVDEFLMKLSR